MLYVFGFERIGVVISDLYFVDPNPAAGQEGAERGVRLELRMLEPGELRSSIYSARPIAVDKPIWRADLLESADGPYGTFDRTHHHPKFTPEWDPSPRDFVPELSADPVPWVVKRLMDLDSLLADAGLAPGDIGPRDAEELRAAVPEIEDTLRRLLARVHAGELATAPEPGLAQARVSWL
jgi:hypothetical protein